MDIRAVAHLDDKLADALARLLAEVVAQGASVGFLAPLSIADARAYVRGLALDKIVLLVAEKDGQIVGTAQLHPASAANGAHRAEVCKLMVHPSEQRRGIARALMERLESEAQKLGRSLLVLDTRSGDVSGDLYRSLGYVEVGHIPRYAKSSTGSLEATTLFYKELSGRR